MIFLIKKPTFCYINVMNACFSFFKVFFFLCMFIQAKVIKIHKSKFYLYYMDDIYHIQYLLFQKNNIKKY